MDEKTKRIAELNDYLRTTFNPAAGMVMITPGINALEEPDKLAIIGLVKTCNTFFEDNDPYGEHDFGSVMHKGNKVYWKIDYYSSDMEGGSEDPSDPEETLRVMTIMLAHEY